MHGVSAERAAMPLSVGVVTEDVHDWRRAWNTHHGSVAADVLVLDEHRRIRSALCHYDPPPAP